jgi:AcrR family transcriptional regulator
MVLGMAERVSRADYFRAAFELLAEGGKQVLTTVAVSNRLGVTTGSLYHHFGSGVAFYQAVIDYWENEHAPAQRQYADAVADPRERIGAFLVLARTADHDLEKAIRAWAATDEAVAAALHRVDRARHTHLTKSYVQAGIERAQADTLARIGFSILIAAQQFGTRVDHKRLNAALDEYGKWVNAATR